MRWIEKFDLFLFDLDGLLVDTEKLHFKAYQRLCSRYGCELDWDFKQYQQIAHTSHDGLKKALHPLLKAHEESWDILYEEKKSLYLDCLRQDPLELMPGAEELIKELSTRGIKRSVATHSPRQQAELIKTRIPILQTIPVWVTREDYSNPKPSPDAYLKAIGLLADPGDKIVGFEDSLRGFQALKETQAEPVLVCDVDHPQLCGLENITHFPSLESLLKRKSL